MSGHTPGPWRAVKPEGGGPHVIWADDEHDHLVARLNWGTRPVNEPANARLIASAPELLEALDGMRRSDGRGGFHNCFCDSERGGYAGDPAPDHAEYCRKARFAIAKAKGEGVPS